MPLATQNKELGLGLGLVDALCWTESRFSLFPFFVPISAYLLQIDEGLNQELFFEIRLFRRTLQWDEMN